VIQGGVAYEYINENWQEATRLEKFKGYFINAAIGGSNLKIPPRERFGTAKISALESLAEGEFELKIEASSGKYHDKTTRLGVRSSAKDQLDILDAYDPPSPSDNGLNVTILEQENGLALSRDFRQTGSDGYFWDFTVKGINLEAPVNLQIASLGLSESQPVWLIEKAKKYAREIQPDESIILKGSEIQQEYRLITGSETFFKDNNLGMGLLPETFTLEQNYPNPFNATTTIRFAVPQEAPVTLLIYDISGRLVHTLAQNQTMQPGFYEIIWNGINEKGQQLASGLYLTVLISPEKRLTSKMALIK
jgi:hypothetical protein